MNQKFIVVHGHRGKPQNLPQVVIIGQGQGFNRFIGNRIQIIGYAVLHLAAFLYKGTDGIHTVLGQRRVNGYTGVIGVRLHVGLIARTHCQSHKHGRKGNGQQDRHNSHCPP